MPPQAPHPSSTHPTHDTPSDARQREVRETILRFAKWLPEQRPLSVFVHSNPLEAVEGHHFHAACEAAARIRGVRTTRDARRYRELVADRHIRPEDVASAKARLDALGLSHIDDLPTPAPSTVLMSRVSHELASEISEMVDAFLLRLLPPFLDLGSALWPMPGREKGLLAVLERLSRAPLGVPEPWLRGLRAFFDPPVRTPLAHIVACLDQRGNPGDGWPHILSEAMFALPGYAGMIQRLEHHPEERPEGVKVSLADYLAARLIVEELALRDTAKRLFGARADVATLAVRLRKLRMPAQTPTWNEDLAVLQDAYEEGFVRSFVSAIVSAQDRPKPARPAAEAQFIVCIDDRCESIRRHVEEVLPEVETVGAAGFFGVALMHREPLTVDDVPRCPAPVTPTKRVIEELPPAGASQLDAGRRRERFWAAAVGDDGSRSLLRGTLASFGSFLRAPRAISQLLFPGRYYEGNHEFEGTQVVHGTDGDPAAFGLEDRVTAVFDYLTMAGIAKRLAPFVMCVGHGSTAVNNPFASGYQCGACGGQRGGFNARVFAAFANDPGVRQGLRDRGLVIDDSTFFVAGEHDTAADAIRWLNLDAMPADRKDAFDDLARRMDTALARNAKERARRFEDVPLGLPPEEALTAVRRRCADFSETRPEYNHATVLGCVIGRRSLTEGLFLDRRTFLVSYDATQDDENCTSLERLMAAPLPVCVGINLEYFFSTMDPVGFGCGTKLPHNVQGLLGVSNGADGDLRPGLWSQTIEIHDPVRQVTVIEAEPEDVTRVLARLPAVRAYADNAWIHLFAVSPSGRGVYRWLDKRFEPHPVPPIVLYEASSSLTACDHTRQEVAPCLVVPTARDERHSEVGR